MPGDTCIVCGNTRASDPSVSFHRFPANPAVWLQVFHGRKLSEALLEGMLQTLPRWRRQDPEVNLGKRFASPKKRDHPRTKRAKRRDSLKELAELRLKSPTVSPSTSRSVTSTVQISTGSGSSTPTTVPEARPPCDASKHCSSCQNRIFGG